MIATRTKIFSLFLLLIMGGGLVVPFSPVQAEGGFSPQDPGCTNCSVDVGGGSGVEVGAAGDQVPVGEITSKPTLWQTTKDLVRESVTFARENYDKILNTTAAITYRTGVRYFLRTLAYDVGTWLGSGGKGQQPLFYTQSWGDYLKNTADAAVGSVIDELSSPGGYLHGFNVCDPSFNVQLRLNLGLTANRPQPPRCRLSTLTANWDRAIHEADFLHNFKDSFNPNENELGAALTVRTGLLARKQNQVAEARLTREEGDGFLGVVEALSNEIKTPAITVRQTLSDTLDTTYKGELYPTGDIIADALETFVNAFASSYIAKKLLPKGINPGRTQLAKRTGLPGAESDSAVEGQAGVEVRLAEAQANFSFPGRYDIVSRLVACPHPDKPGPNDCVIADGFASAIQQRITVEQAVKQGLISGRVPFGFLSADPKQPVEPAHTNGIPFRSILILRKHGIVPVGWELAARYVRHFHDRQVSLQNLLDAHDDPSSPFYQLVDPHWVLVPPDGFCRLQGAGPQIFSTQTIAGQDTNNDGDFLDSGDTKPSIEVARNENYCADEQTCIQRDAKGNCQFYGYCLEQRPTWTFAENSCDAQFASCTTLTNEETGVTVSYLLNTVNFDSCDSNSVGCEQYSTARTSQSVSCGAADGSTPPDGIITSSDVAVARKHQTSGCPLTGTCQGDLNGNGWVSEEEVALIARWAASGTACNAENIYEWSADPDDQVFLNVRAETCDASDAGCTEFIRTGLMLPQTLGVNLLPNPGFELEDEVAPGTVQGWTQQNFTLVEGDAFEGNSFLRAGSSAVLRTGVNVSDAISFGAPITGQPITVSFAARKAGGGSFSANPVALMTGHPFASWVIHASASVDQPLLDTWQVYTTTMVVTTPGVTATDLMLTIPDGIDIDAVKLTIGTAQTAFTSYGQGVNQDGRVHLKLAPTYTHLDCRPSLPAEQNPPEPAQAACQPYARFCHASEVGCLAYEPVSGGLPITATSGQTCPAECVGFDTYTQGASFFEPIIPNVATANIIFSDFIPDSARACPAANVGCSEFTNLDTAAQGGESRTYYQELRYCQKRDALNPNTNATDSAFYYSWEGAEEQGYKLHTFILKQTNLVTTTIDLDDDGNFDTTASSRPPCTRIAFDSNGDTACIEGEFDSVSNTMPDVSIGAETVTAKVPAVCTPDEADHNPDCREFFDGNGHRSFRLLSMTVSVNDSCQPLRKTEANQQTCEDSNGWWRTATNECVYQAVPGEGKQCPVSAAGCREYRGGTANNFRQLAFDRFEEGAGGWKNGVLSPIASVVGGHSLQSTGGAPLQRELTVSRGESTVQEGALVRGASYLVSFSARAREAQQFILNAAIVRVGGGLPDIALGSVAIDSEWRQYQLEIFTLDKIGSQSNSLTIDGSDQFLIDNVEIRSTTNTFYAIRNSWKTPASCIVPDRVLGCQAYEVSDGVTRNVWQFGPSCSAEVVGCEALINTQNTTIGDVQPFESVFKRCSNNVALSCAIDSDCNGGTCDAAVTVPADNVELVVNNDHGRCDSDVQGCQELGLGSSRDTNDFTAIDGWQTVYKENNADQYGQILCHKDQVECSAFGTPEGQTIHFKDPEEFLCNYRTDVPVHGWYKANSKSTIPDCQGFCSNDTTKACVADSDCSGGGSCQVAPRVLHAPQAIGQPLPGWTGSCPAAQHSCRELFDPRSDSARNLLYNGNFVVPAPDQNIPDRWNVYPFIGSTAVANPSTFAEHDTDNGAVKVKTGSNGGTLGVVKQLNVSVRKNTTYLISADVKLGGVADPSHAALLGISSSCKGDSIGYTIFAPTADNNVTTAADRFSFQFTATEDKNDCSVYFGLATALPILGLQYSDATMYFKNVSMREAQVHYELAKDLDRQSCSGVVNNTDCVLVNEASGLTSAAATVLGVRGVVVDADLSPTSARSPETKTRPEYFCDAGTSLCNRMPGKSCQSDADCQLHFDATASVIKVQPGSECGRWLSCETSERVVSNGQVQNVCLGLEACEALDSQGNCTRQVDELRNVSQTFSPATIDGLRYLSGYSRAGFNWGNRCVGGPVEGSACSNAADCNGGSCEPALIQGYLPPAHMSPVGEKTRVPNGDFEVATANGNPRSWQGWENGFNFSVIDNPVSAQRAGVVYPAQGRNFLEVNANHPVPQAGFCEAEVTQACLSDDDCSAYADTTCTIPIDGLPAANVSDFISVTPGEEYVVSAMVNTRGFKGRRTELRIYEFDGQHNRETVGVPTPVASADSCRGIDIVLVLDHSGSVCDTFPGDDFDPATNTYVPNTCSNPPELTQMIAAAKGFVDSFPKNGAGNFVDGVQIGVVGFSADATETIPLSLNAGAVKAAIDNVSGLPQTGTKMSLGINQATTTLQAGSPTNKKVMVVLTDGSPDSADKPLTVTAATAAKSSSLIYSIGVGITTADSDWLKANVTTAPSYYVHAIDFGALASGFDALKSQLCPVNANYGSVLNLGGGFGWTKVSDRFVTGNNTSFIQLQMAWDGHESSGFWHIDDIKLEPALRYQTNDVETRHCLLSGADCTSSACAVNTGPCVPDHTNPDFAENTYSHGIETLDAHYEPVSCRLYPQQNALSCNYRDDSGSIQRGRHGYCLEWDSQNDSVCLQWWPVDSVTGDDFAAEDRVGYEGRASLFYCTAAAEGFLQASSHFPCQRVTLASNDADIQLCETVGGKCGSVCVGGSNQNSPCRTDAECPGSQCGSDPNPSNDNEQDFLNDDAPEPPASPALCEESRRSDGFIFDTNVHSDTTDTDIGNLVGSSIYGGVIDIPGFCIPRWQITICEDNPNQVCSTSADCATGACIAGDQEQYYAGCEIIVRQTHTRDVDNGRDHQIAAVSKDRLTWYVIGGGVQRPDFPNIFMYDVANATDASGNRVEGPWRYVRIQDNSHSGRGGCSAFSGGERCTMGTIGAIVTLGLPIDEIIDFFGDIWCGIKRIFGGSCGPPSPYSNFNSEQIWIRPQQACQVITQTVAVDGQNRAWADRLGEGSSFAIPNLGHTRRTDYEPFGSLVQPGPVDQPEEWDSQTLPGRQPLFIKPPTIEASGLFSTAAQPPYQARGGTPFSCVQPNITWGDTGTDYHVDSCTEGCMPQAVSQCFGGTNDGASCGANRVCDGGTNDGNACSTGADCPDGHCPINIEDPVCTGGGYCGCAPSPTGRICNNNPQQSCTSDLDCATLLGQLNQPQCYFDGSLLPDTATRNVANVNTGAVGGEARIAASTIGILNLEQLFVESYGSWEWTRRCADGPEAGNFCRNDGDCPGSNTPNRCEGRYEATGLIRNLRVPTNQCNTAHRCVQSKAACLTDADCKIAGDTCDLGSTFTNIRPINDTNLCAVAPVITAIRLTPDDNVNGISLSFTAVADSGQEPISQYIVDWGDGKRTVRSSLRMASRPTINNAVTLTHSYSFEDVRDCYDRQIEFETSGTGAGCNAASQNACGPGARCISPLPVGAIDPDAYLVTPRVQITDNWGWCSGIYQSATTVSPDIDPHYPLAEQVGYHKTSDPANNCGDSNPNAWMPATATADTDPVLVRRQ